MEDIYSKNETTIDLANKKDYERRKKETYDLMEQEKIDIIEEEKKEKNIKEYEAVAFAIADQEEFASREQIEKVIKEFALAAENLQKLFDKMLEKENDEEKIKEAMTYVRVFSIIKECFERERERITPEQLYTIENHVGAISKSNDMQDAIKEVKSLAEAVINFGLFVNEISKTLGEPIPKLGPVEFNRSTVPTAVPNLDLSLVGERILNY